LTAALKEGQIALAALDVTEQEPLQSQSELRGLDNVIITPHCGLVLGGSTAQPAGTGSPGSSPGIKRKSSAQPH